MFSLFGSRVSHPELKDQITIFVCGYEGSPQSSQKIQIIEALKNEGSDTLFNKVCHLVKSKLSSNIIYVSISHDGQFEQQIKKSMRDNKINNIAFFVLYHRTQDKSFNAAKEYVEVIKTMKSSTPPIIVMISTGEGVLRKHGREDFTSKAQKYAEEKNIVHASLQPIVDCEYHPSAIYQTLKPCFPDITESAKIKKAVSQSLELNLPKVLVKIVVDYIPPVVGYRWM